jgi:hypothetical protein
MIARGKPEMQSLQINHKVILLEINQPFPFHFPQLFRQGCPLHPQIIRKLLPVKGNLNVHGILAGNLFGKVGIQPPPNSLWGGMENPHGQPQIFSGSNQQKVGN